MTKALTKTRAMRAETEPLHVSSGYVLATGGAAGPSVVTLTAPDGRLCLKLWLLEDGPVVEVHGQALHLRAEHELRLECERLVVRAKQETSIRTGKLTQEVVGDAQLRAGGIVRSEGHAHDIRAHRGDIALTANDDVCVDGERIRLNSPKVGRAPRQLE